MASTGNFLLDSLPDTELEILRRSLRRVEVPRGEVLFESGAILDSVEFPIDMVVSLTSQTREGDPIEISMIGPEGMLGAWLAVGVDWSPWAAVAQVGGESWRCTSTELLRALPHMPHLAQRLQQYALMQTFLISQSVLCNRFHELPQRTARWLLILDSKTTTEPLPVTQEFLSQMLGVHRPSVTLALQGLAEAGFIRNEGRGLIAILDRHGLETTACECVQQVRAFNRSVTGRPDGRFGPA